MKRLPDHIESIGADYRLDNGGHMSADLVKREKNVAIYLREDGYYEVGTIFCSKGGPKSFGGVEVIYEAKENYFANYQFGDNAICTSFLNNAEKYFDRLLALNSKSSTETRIYTS